MQNTNVKPAPAVMPKPAQKKRPQSLNARKSRAGWLFIAPFLIGFIIVYLPMIIDSINYSFNEIDTLSGGGYELIYVGWDNYADALFDDPNFVQILVTSVRQLIFDIPAVVIFSLFMAILLNQKMVGRAAFRAIFFIPVILATGIIEKIDLQNQMIQYMSAGGSIDTGGSTQTSTVTEIVSYMDVRNLFGNMKVGQDLVIYVVNAVNNIYNIINRSGVQMLIFLAGLQAISPAIYESAVIEGSSAWETFWKITFPMISPMILVNAIYTVIDSFTSKQNSVMSYISNVYKQPGGNVLSSAMAWMYFLIVLLIIAAVAGVISAFVFYQRRD